MSQAVSEPARYWECDEGIARRDESLTHSGKIGGLVGGSDYTGQLTQHFRPAGGGAFIG